MKFEDSVIDPTRKRGKKEGWCNVLLIKAR